MVPPGHGRRRVGAVQVHAVPSELNENPLAPARKSVSVTSSPRCQDDIQRDSIFFSGIESSESHHPPMATGASPGLTA